MGELGVHGQGGAHEGLHPSILTDAVCRGYEARPLAPARSRRRAHYLYTPVVCTIRHA